MLAAERKGKILRMLEINPAVRVTDLRQLLRVSEASVRRDLSYLEKAGLLKRTYGGAVSNRSAAFEPSLTDKEDRYLQEKVQIAVRAAQLIEDGETVVLDAGSTTLQIARQLRLRRGKQHVTVVTNGLNVAWELAATPVDVIVIGGILRQKTLSVVGPVADEVLSSLQADKLFLGANGVDVEKGVTTPNLIEARTKKAMLKSAKEIFVVADHSKLGQVTFAQVCTLDEIDGLITDCAVPGSFVAALEKRGVQVLVAGPNETLT